MDAELATRLSKQCFYIILYYFNVDAVPLKGEKHVFILSDVLPPRKTLNEISKGFGAIFPVSPLTLLNIYTCIYINTKRKLQLT